MIFFYNLTWGLIYPIRGFSSFLLLNDSKTENESENMINFLCLLFETMLSARSLTWTSAMKMEFFIGRAFSRIFFRTAAHAVLGVIRKYI